MGNFTILGITIAGVKAIKEGGGISLTIMGMAVVFTGLIVLTIVLYNLERVIHKLKKWHKHLSSSGEEVQETEEAPPLTGEEAAAISMAIILYHRMHMTERRERLTAQSELKKLSPWALSGKIHRTGGPFLKI